MKVIEVQTHNFGSKGDVWIRVDKVSSMCKNGGRVCQEIWISGAPHAVIQDRCWEVLAVLTTGWMRLRPLCDSATIGMGLPVVNLALRPRMKKIPIPKPEPTLQTIPTLGDLHMAAEEDPSATVPLMFERIDLLETALQECHHRIKTAVDTVTDDHGDRWSHFHAMKNALMGIDQQPDAWTSAGHSRGPDEIQCDPACPVPGCPWAGL